MNLEDLNDDLLLLIIDMVCKKSYIPVGILNKRFYSLFNSSEHEEENDSKKDNSNDNNNNNILIRKTKPLAKESSLKYMLDMSNISELFQIYGCKISPGLSRAIVEDEHYGLHQWCKQTCSNNNTDDESSDLDTISCNTNNDCLTVEVVWKAAEYGKLDIIRDFWDISSDWDNLAEDVAQIACERGHLNTLKWLKEEMDNTATVNGSASDSASSVGQSSQPSPFIYEIEGLCDYAASNGHLDILQWLLQLYKDRIKEAKEIGNQNIVDYLQNDGILWNEITFCGASSNGQTYVCQFLRENDCPWDASAIAGAAKYNHLETLQYLIENGCPCNHKKALICASQEGHLEILKYLKNNGIWDSLQVSLHAAMNGQLHILKWLREQGLSLHKKICVKAAQNSQLSVLKWLVGTGMAVSTKDSNNAFPFAIVRWDRDECYLNGDSTIRQWITDNF